MKNSNKGFGRFEVLTMVVIGIIVLAIGMYAIINKAGSQKFETMKNSAVNFGKTVGQNIDSFHNLENIYLSEVISEGFLKKIKSPFSSGDCDVSESKVEMIDGLPYVTLKCDKYLISKSRMNSTDEMDIYEVSNWSDKSSENKNEETNVFYNCKDDSGKEIFPEYYEELYFISELNKKFDTDYYTSLDVDSCEVVSKNMYRNKVVKD